MKNPLVSVITINYNQVELTLDMLNSLGSEHLDIEIIVVDNNSAESPKKRIKEQFPRVKVIESQQNLGFAGGNNLGMCHANGEYLFFVNNDTVIPKGTISRLIKTMQLHPKTGMVCPRIYFHHDPKILQYAGYSPINTLTGRNHAIGFGQQVEMQDYTTSTAYAHGAAMMVRKEVIDQVGNMPENYFLYYEELDWAHRIRQCDYEIRVDHACCILHKESMTVGKLSPLKTYFQTRNRILFMRRNSTRLKRLAFLLFFFLIALPKNIAAFAIRREFKLLSSFVSGVWWNLSHSIDSKRLGFGYD